eukprot:Plantae.Rhodophyta-Purpureofilum_apyrenoidigerum.ctg18656.p1 GENE.Plantae.Rhodophyta-Purpureofilum_apyrenoidigerum.ctg18656~~Plantae.Rhodophyta-Purpureofilum_apyrenoidigerum.ctg18656.p1  ORF type:complete len:252 (+),score=17.76 Plantae.Rhodophyta-Purpureofilum_apyrenoidigerum.ctg18656:89-757(+)
MSRAAFVHLHVGTRSRRQIRLARMSEEKLFVAQCFDREDAGDLRASTRPAHLQWLIESKRVVLGGALLGGDHNSAPIGSLLVFKQKGLNAAAEWLRQDPYSEVNLFKETIFRPWKKVFAPSCAPSKTAFALICMDKPESREVRAETRSSHLSWWANSKRDGLLGPFLSDDEGQSIGSLIITSDVSWDGMKKWSESDPYATSGLFQNTQLFALRPAVYDGQPI